MITGIDRWPQRARFNELLDEWCKRNHANLADFAKACEKSASSIYTYSSRIASRPPEPLMRVFAKTLGCSILEFTTDPAATIAGQAVDGLSEREQVLAEMLFSKFRDPALSEDDRQMLFEDWMRDYDRIKTMKARHQK